MGVDPFRETVDLEAAEVAGYADWFAAAPLDIAEEFDIRSTHIGDAVCCAVGALSGSRLVNHVVGLGRSALPTGEDLDAIAGFYRDVGVQYVVAVRDGDGKADLGAELEGRGFEDDYAWVKFCRASEPPRPVETELEIAEIDRGEARSFGAIVVGGFGLPDGLAGWCAAAVGRPGWRCYLAYADSVPAASGALFVAGDSAWLTFAATHPDFRRRGAQSALLERRITDAISTGCSQLVTETGEIVDGKPSNSYRNILRAGFQVAYRRRNLLSPA